MNFSVSGNKLTITTATAPTDTVTISATKNQTRSGVIVWSDGKHQSSGHQDTVTYSATVSDPVKAFLKVKVSYGSAKIIKTSEDGVVSGITFTVVGEGVNQTVTTNAEGEIIVDNLMPDLHRDRTGLRQIRVAGDPPCNGCQRTDRDGLFNNVLKRGELRVTKTPGRRHE